MARWRGMEAEGEWAGRHGQARRELIEDGRGLSSQDPKFIFESHRNSC